MALWYVAFAGGAIVSLATSWLLVTRLERVGERFGFSEALLGVVAALAADAPEITSAITALGQHQRSIGAGVVVGSNVFNLAALLGLGAVVAGFVSLHRRVVIFSGAVAIAVAVLCTLSTYGLLSPTTSLVVCALLLLLIYASFEVNRTRLARAPYVGGLSRWLERAIDEEEMELNVAIRPRRATRRDFVLAPVALVIVVMASIAMEHGATKLGEHFHVANAIVGALVLAAVTSLPNAVAAVYLSSKGRGAAALSTAFNSNNLNVLAGLLVPGSIVGLGRPTWPGEVTSVSYLLLTGLVVLMAYGLKGLDRRAGTLIIAGYLGFVAWLCLTVA